MRKTVILILLAVTPLMARATPEERAEDSPIAAGASVSRASQTRVLSLQEAYRFSMAKNPTIELMNARIASAEAETRRAWAQLKPTAQLQGTFTRSHPEIIVDPSMFAPAGAPVGDPIVIQKRDQFGFQVQASLPVFRGPAYQQIGVARKTARAAALRLIRVRQMYAMRVAQAYYAALSLKEVVTALDEKIAVDRRNLAAARARLEVGQVTRSDVLRAELELVRDEQQRLQQNNASMAMKRRVAILVGLDGMIELEQPEEPAAPREEVPRLVERASRRRTDLLAVRTDLAAAEQSKTAVWWSFLPLLDLNFLYRWQQAAGFAGQKDNWSIVAALTLPIYEGGVRYAEIDRARAQIRQATAAEAELSRDIAERLTQLRADLASAEAGLVSAQKALSLADVTVEEMSARYESGTATQLDLLDATQRRLQARIDLSRSRFDRDVARLAVTNELGDFDPAAAAR